jgi:predicted Zn-dependent peptidase
MNRLAAQEFYFGKHIPDEEILTEIDAIHVQKLQSLADGILRDALGKATVAVVGPEAHENYRISSIKRLLDGHP